MGNALRKHGISLQNAFSGIRWALTTQPNFRIHAFCAVAVIVAGWYVSISSVEWTIIVCMIVLGLSGEMINTSLEAMTDLITTKWRQNAKIAKDVSAGMMLTIAIGAIVVAVLIFVPKFLIRFGW